MVDFLDPVPNRPIFTKIPGLVDGSKGLFTSLSFISFLKEHCNGNQLNSKNRRFFADQSTLSHCHSKTDCNIAIWFQSFREHIMSFSALCTILVTFSPVTPEFILLTITSNKFLIGYNELPHIHLKNCSLP